jgi:hypothetical protein
VAGKTTLLLEYLNMKYYCELFYLSVLQLLLLILLCAAFTMEIIDICIKCESSNVAACKCAVRHVACLACNHQWHFCRIHKNMLVERKVKSIEALGCTCGESQRELHAEGRKLGTAAGLQNNFEEFSKFMRRMHEELVVNVDAATRRRMAEALRQSCGDKPSMKKKKKL